MNLKLLLFLVPAIVFGDDLKTLLDVASSSNKLLISKTLIERSRAKNVEAANSAYFPTVDVGGYYKRDDEPSPFQAGDTFSAFAKVGVDLYDGGKASHTIKEREALRKASNYDASSYSKSLQLRIVEDFFGLKSAEAILGALSEADAQLLAELQRVKKFYEVGSATQDEIERLEAAYENNKYAMSATRYQISFLKKSLSLKVGSKVSDLDPSSLKEPVALERELSDEILKLQANASSLDFAAKALDSNYSPSLRLEDVYSVYGYSRKDPKVTPVNNQNELMLTLNMRLFDMGAISKRQESLFLEKEALLREIEQFEEEQKSDVELAILKIETVKAQIASAKSSLASSSGAYETVLKKYSVGYVDYVTYLDSLTVKTQAKAQYETALNNLQIAYATYYHHTNKDIKDFIK